jgi:hypothetical protein
VRVPHLVGVRPEPPSSSAVTERCQACPDFGLQVKFLLLPVLAYFVADVFKL